MKVENDSRFHFDLRLIDRADPIVRPLTAVTLNKTVRIGRLEGPHQDCARLLDLGFVAGTPVEVEMVSPAGDPTAYRVRGTVIALRREQAGLIRLAHQEAVAA